jgi:hypothetical protein
MKRFLIVAALFLTVGEIKAQLSATNSTRLKDLAGKQIISSTFDNDGKPYIICFWSRQHNDSHLFLNTIAPQYSSWQKETGVKLITVAEEEEGHSDKVLPFIQSKGWTYENYIDEGEGYKKLMNVHDIPHIFVYNGKKQLVLQLQSFQPGDEIAILEAVRGK